MPNLSYVVPVSWDGTAINANSFTFFIKVPFFPDEVIVRSIAYDGGGSGNVRLIQSDLINTPNQNILIPIIDTTDNSHHEVIHKLGRPVDGTYTFNILNASGKLVTAYQFQICIMLEFKKY